MQQGSNGTMTGTTLDEQQRQQMLMAFVADRALLMDIVRDRLCQSRRVRPTSVPGPNRRAPR